MGGVPGDRGKWRGTLAFILACVGSGTGLTAAMRFPYYMYKHGGQAWILCYGLALFAVAAPLIYLELALGQKFQRGAANAIRGVNPRLSGVGWAASFAGFTRACLNCFILGIAMLYMIKANDPLPWSAEGADRPLACSTAANAQMAPAELYFYLNVAKYIDPADCTPIVYPNAPFLLNWEIFIGVAVSWLLVFVFISAGPRSISYVAYLMSFAPIAFLAALLVKALLMDWRSELGGLRQMMSLEPIYMAGAPAFPHDYLANRDELFYDAFHEAVIGTAVCMGGYFAYGSYRSKVHPIAASTLLVVLSNLIVSVGHACFAFTALNYLRSQGDSAMYQYGNTGLNFIAIPRLTYHMGSEGQLWVRLYMIYMYFLGLDSTYGFVEGLVANIIDMGEPDRRVAVAFGVCACGAGVTLLFCGNIGWILVDATEHFLYYVLVPVIGLLECVLIGW